MTTTRNTVDSASVELPGGRRFEATLMRAGDGTPLDLVLAVSFSESGRGWRSFAGHLALPPSALPEIRKALEALEAA